MPWQNELPMEQKQRFINLAQSGYFTVSELCEELGIARKTGHKWLARHAAGGMVGLVERSRAPKSVTGRTSQEVERLIVGEKRRHLTWGPKKIRRVLEVKHGMERLPAVSTVGEVLQAPRDGEGAQAAGRGVQGRARDPHGAKALQSGVGSGL